MLGVRRTAESNKAKRMPCRDPAIRAVKAPRERLRVKFLHRSGAGVHIEGIGPAQRAPRPSASSCGELEIRTQRPGAAEVVNRRPQVDQSDSHEPIRQ
jgi:hypothetical protein